MPNIVSVFLRWMGMRAALHRGYWLVTSLYLVVDANLSPFQLVFLGTAQGIISLVGEVPAGVVADTISRKWALVIAHSLVGVSMVITGLATAFPALIATQMVWGLGWSFASGADIAWVTDELNRPDRIDRVLAARARWELIGSACGMMAVGLLAVAMGRGTVMVMAGVGMILLGLYVVVWFPEHRFIPTRPGRGQKSAAILRTGIGLARHDRDIMLILLATVLINGAADGYGRLYPRQIVSLGFPNQSDPVMWFTGLSISALVFGAIALRIVEARINGAGVARRIYVMACFVGALGLAVLAGAAGFAIGSLGILLVSGIALTVTRAVGEIWVNRRTSSEVRATMQSILAQAEYTGEILLGVMLGILAQFTSITLAFACSAVLISCAGFIVVRSRPGNR